jgi:putative tryptophan/tyrosine transport system substrate-binding protein
MRRREFIAIVGSAAAWPFGVSAQQTARVRSIGILLGAAIEDPFGRAMIATVSRALQDLGWVDGKNARIHYRGSSNPEELRKHASELATLAPDVLLATGGTSAGPLLQASKTIPIVFANVPDPVGSGFVEVFRAPVATPRGSCSSNTI